MKTRLLVMFSLIVFGVYPAFAVEQNALNAYEQLNYRLATDPEFAQLVQTVEQSMLHKNTGLLQTQ